MSLIRSFGPSLIHTTYSMWQVTSSALKNSGTSCCCGQRARQKQLQRRRVHFGLCLQGVESSQQGGLGGLVQFVVEGWRLFTMWQTKKLRVARTLGQAITFNGLHLMVFSPKVHLSGVLRCLSILTCYEQVCKGQYRTRPY